MKKSLAKYFAVYQHLDLTAQSVEKLYVEALDDSQLKRVLDEIFSVASNRRDRKEEAQ